MSANSFNSSNLLHVEEACGVPDLEIPDVSSSTSNSHFTSPDNSDSAYYFNRSAQGAPAALNQTTTLKVKNHPYSRIAIKDLMNPVTPNTDFKEKKRAASPQTLAQSVRKGLQMVHHQQRISRASSNSSSMVRCLVDLSIMTIDMVWGPNGSSGSKEYRQSLHHYVTELFRRSRVTKTVVQFALMYCLKVKDTVAVTRQLVLARQTSNDEPQNAAFCGRRMFLAALICASKYLQDSNFSNKTWAKIVGLSPYETTLTEASFLRLLDYHLYVKEVNFLPYAKAILNLSSVMEPVLPSAYKLIEELFAREDNKARSLNF